MDDDIRIGGALRCGYWPVRGHLYIVHHQYDTDTKVSCESSPKAHFIFSFLDCRPRFVTLGQIEDTGIFKNIVYFPSVSGRSTRPLARFSVLGATIPENQDSALR